MKLACAFAAVAAAAAAALYFGVAALSGNPTVGAVEAAAITLRPASPTAAEFARALAGTANQYSGGARLTHTHCVQAARAHYMCSFVVEHADGTSECHLVQARWTPNAASTITVTLAGRVARCASLREAIDSMG
jgi:hypothetical protein